MISNHVLEALQELRILLVEYKTKNKNLNNILKITLNLYSKDFFNPELFSFQDKILELKEILKENKKATNLIKDWLELKRRKVDFISSNKQLKDLPSPKDQNHFYVKVLELNPYKLTIRHVINDLQWSYQKKRSNEELISFDTSDPFTGRRKFSLEDNTNYSGSVLVIKTGHHRIYEIYQRYLEGKIEGDTLIEFTKV